ncbi:biotin-dependent carboxyltransferase family protein [Bacillus sp. NPDC077027]|uniref:5-oxoprolinase subunit C family protein n=1 Tax=Bacillus sp. NPDC077027 TaxID=3390548 RepID=UPI003D00FB54
MSIHVIKPGIFTTIQDKGRTGYQKYGVLTSGAMDPISRRVANLLTGNHQDEAVLEITLVGPGPAFTFEEDHVIAITGAEVTLEIDGQPAPLWKPIFVRAGSMLSFGPCKLGCRAYLAVAGGFNVLTVMNSKSTYVRAGIGGYKGRSLQKGDILQVGHPSILSHKMARKRSQKTKNTSFATPDWTVSHYSFLPLRKSPVIRVLPGRHFPYVEPSSQVAFFESEFQVTPQSDRMGCRLKGEPIRFKQNLELISEAVAFGSIQIPPDGQPIILLADRQTTGGYPRIGEIASVDLPLIAQARLGATIQFQRIDRHEAEEAIFTQEEQIRKLVARLKIEVL